MRGAPPGRGGPTGEQVRGADFPPRRGGAAGAGGGAWTPSPPQATNFFRQPQTILRDAPQATDTISLPVYVYVSAAGARLLLGAPLDSVRAGAAGKTGRGSVSFGETPPPARNAVAIFPGSDPKLE